MSQPVLGYKTCPTCQSIMYESVGEDCKDYYICSNCQTKIRIFHKLVQRHNVVPMDYPIGHA